MTSCSDWLTHTAAVGWTLYLQALQDGSALLLQDPAGVLGGQRGPSLDVALPDGHPGHAGLARLVVLLELQGRGRGLQTTRLEQASLCRKQPVLVVIDGMLHLPDYCGSFLSHSAPER